MKQKFNYLLVTTQGFGTFTVPGGTEWLMLTGTGGGGSGASGTTSTGGPGGGGSGVQTRLLRVVPGQIYQYYIGNGGQTAGNFFSGSDGEPTWFGPEVFAGGSAGVTAGFPSTPSGVTPRQGYGNNFGGQGALTGQYGGQGYTGWGTSASLALPTGGAPGSSTTAPGGGGGGGGAGLGAAGSAGAALSTSGSAGAANSGAGGGGSGAGTSQPGAPGPGGSGFLYITWVQS